MAALYTLRDFAFATVMDVEIFPEGTQFALIEGKLTAVVNPTATPLVPVTPIAVLDSLTMSNITQEGPTKETRGGIYAEPIIRHKKTMRVEMEDVVLKPEALEVLFGATLYKGAEGTDEANQIVGFGMTDRFASMLTLKGRTYVVDREDGTRKWIDIVFKRFLPDSVVDMMMEAEGDLGVVNVAGELFPDFCGEYFTVGRAVNTDCADEDLLGTQVVPNGNGENGGNGD
jgi:hypothetical protein